MALKPKKARDDSQTSSEPSLLVREITALFFLAVGVFILLCLLSYDPLDPSLSTFSHAKQVNNSGGIVGAYLADLLIFLVGGAAYLIGTFFFVISILLFSGIRRSFRLHEMAVTLVFVVLMSVVFELSLGQLTFANATLAAGGFLGSMAAQIGVAFFGKLGTYLVVFFGALLTFVWATHLSIQQMTRGIHSVVMSVGRWIAQWTSIYYARTKKMVAKLWQSFRERRKEQVPVEEVRINKPTPFSTPTQRPIAKENPKLSVEPSSSADSKTIEKPQPRAVEPSLSTGAQGPKILDRIDKKRSKNISPQLELEQLSAGYHLPPVSLLDSEAAQDTTIDEESLKMQARMLEKKLLDFNVEGRVTEIHPGPVITMFEFEPAPGVKLSRIANLVDDLSLAMGGRSVRIVAPLPNKAAVGIEIPNNVRETVWLKDVIADDKFQKSESKLIFALGKDIEGIPYVSDLAKMPHLLVAGATGAGKSVSINSMIISILYKASPEEVRLIMVDPKMLELSIYEGIPHLLLPVVTEPKKAALALRWAVREMERRYRLLADVNARNILDYNAKITKGNIESRQAKQIEGGATVAEEDIIKHEGKLPYIVILIDELADLMMVSSREVEEAITRLAQMARAAGLHLILATQRPSVDVLTGVIKANFPSRISFKVSSKHDSRTILDTVGSEHLLGAGDMLFIPPGISRLIRVHGALITEPEIARVVDFLKKQAKPIYDESILKPIESEAVEGEGGSGDEETDALYDQAVSIVAETRQASISMIQRKLRIGYNRAARMIEKMESEGIVSPPSGAGHRQVLVNSFQAPQ